MSSRKEDFNAAAESVAHEVAAAADAHLGRSKPDADEYEQIETHSLVSDSVRKNVDYVEATTSVSVAGVGLALVAVLGGSGSTAGLVDATAEAMKRTTTVGSVVNFAQAFALTLPLSICITALVWLLLAGKLNSYGAGFLFIGGVLAVTYYSARFGIDGPALEDMGRAVGSGSSPLHKGLSALLEYAKYYGPVPFLGGIITGVAAGRYGYRVSLRHGSR